MAGSDGFDRRLLPHPGQTRYPLPADPSLSATETRRTLPPYQQGRAPQTYDAPQNLALPPLAPGRVPPAAIQADESPTGGSSEARGGYLPLAGDNEAPSAGGAGTAQGRLGATGRGLHRRVVAKGRNLTVRGIEQFRRAANADGADRSGLAALTYPVIINSACDAAMAVALASTLFFAAAKAESQTKVLLYLLVNIAPFAVIAPLIGPFLDRIQQGRRAALAISFVGRALLALIIASNCTWDGKGHTLNYEPWVLYPCALGMMVFSKSFVVLKAAVTPRVLPSEIDLVRTNARLNLFALTGGSVGGGAVAVVAEFVFSKLFHLPGGMYVIVAAGAFGAWLCMRIPKWVEITEGEVPAALSYHEQEPPAAYANTRWQEKLRTITGPKISFGRGVITGLWGTGTIKWMGGYLLLYVAFFSKAHHEDGLKSLLTLGIIGGAAGVGTFVGTAMGTKNTFGKHERVILSLLCVVTVASVVTTLAHTILTAAITGFIVGFASSVAKTALDASIMDDLPEQAQASGFGRSETVLQLCWVIGAAMGLLAPTELRWGFLIASIVLFIGGVQTYVSHIGKSLIPNFGGRRPEHDRRDAVADGGGRSEWGTAPGGGGVP